MMTLQEYAEKHKTDLEPAPATAAAGNVLAKRMEEREAAENRSAAICREYQANTNRSAVKLAEILKGLKAGRPIADLFLLAMQVIGDLTHNQATAAQAEADMLAVYGYGLRDPEPAAIEAAAVRERIERMTAAVNADSVPAEVKRPIEKAIAAHRRALEWLQSGTGGN